MSKNGTQVEQQRRALKNKYVVLCYQKQLSEFKVLVSIWKWEG